MLRSNRHRPQIMKDTVHEYRLGLKDTLHMYMLTRTTEMISYADDHLRQRTVWRLAGGAERVER